MPLATRYTTPNQGQMRALRESVLRVRAIVRMYGSRFRKRLATQKTETVVSDAEEYSGRQYSTEREIGIYVH